MAPGKPVREPSQLVENLIDEDIPLKTYKICVIGGSCGHRMMMVAEHLSELMQARGYPCRFSTHSVWENYSTPPLSDLILQLLPAFTQLEAGCPVLSIRPLLIDLDHPETIARIMAQVCDLVAKETGSLNAANLKSVCSTPV